MDASDLAVFLMVVSSTLIGTTILFAVLWVRARERVLRTRLDAQSRPDAGNDRIEHLVNAVEAMSIEVERISEAQRFTAQVLSERADAADAAAVQPRRVPERVITPH